MKSWLASGPGAGLVLVFRALRPHHWSKNTLVFVPPLLAHRWDDLTTGIRASLAFAAFNLVASSVYVINDLVDLEIDRRHSSKRNRPFASGALSPAVGPPLALLLAGTGLSIALLALPASFVATLLTYFALTLLYTFWIKRRLLLDVLLLAMLYSLRLLGGGRATETPISEWLLAFSVFFFLSLAFVKRYSELVTESADETPMLAFGRRYRVSDLGIIESVGPSSGYIAVLILALYVSGEPVAALYSNPSALWLICPLLLYWITRVWFFAKRAEMHDDPVVFALTDRVSILTGVCVMIILFMAVAGLGPRFD